jgi:branched-chain amino acid transport system substrate-binding protein
MKHQTKVLAAVAALSSFAAHADVTVKIGSAAPLTGGIAHIGQDQDNGARLAIEEINAKGLTIGGQKVTLVFASQDDAADPRTATQAAQKFVDDKVVAVVGHTTSGTTIPASKIYSDANIVQISPSATNPQYTLQGFKTTYRLVATDAQQGPALANYAVNTMKAKSVAIVDDATAYGKGLADEFEKTAQKLGVKVVSHDGTSDKSIDFRSVLTKIKRENPDVIMYGGMDSTGGPFTQQARQLGLRAKVLGGDGLCTDKTAELAGAAADNIVCSQAGQDIDQMPGGKAFTALYQKRFNQPIQLYAPAAYDAVYIIVEAMKRANSTDPAKIVAAMPATNYKGVIGETTFDAKGDLTHGIVSLYSFKGGKRTLIDSVRM